MNIYVGGTKYFDIQPGGPVEVKNADLKVSGNNVLTTADEGSGNGLNADTVGGKHASDIGGGSPIYGDGSDGSITYSSNSSAGGVVEATTFEVQSGVNLSVNGNLIVHATESITVNGTINARGEGASSDSPGQLNWSEGSAGSGGGGGESRFDGGKGGNKSGSESDERIDYDANISPAAGIVVLLNPSRNAAAGGGSGGSGDQGGAGGAGGNGGGFVALIAPEVNVNGTIDVRGQDGADGQDSNSGEGGGGGGAGGVIQIMASSVNESSPSYLTRGGYGGSGGTGTTDDWGDGSDGRDGNNGGVLKYSPS